MRRALAACLVLAACGAPGAPGRDGGTVATGTDGGDGGEPIVISRLDALLVAEQRRAAAAVTAADQQSRDVVVRRAAARALARIGGGAARAGLLRALADEDGEVVAWGAYGLGFSCKGHEKESTAALVARGLALARPAAGAPAPRIQPGAAIARAVGRCGAEEAEPTLVAWLAGAGEQAVAAAFALGDLASSAQKLREETLAALLNLAAGSASAPPVPEALFPVGRLEHVPLTVVDCIREVATARLAGPGEARLFAVRALGRGGEGAAPELARVLGAAGSFSAAERAEAARGLARLGKVGQRALAAALPALIPIRDPVALTGLVGEDFGVLLTAVESLSDPTTARKALADSAALAPPPGAPAQVLRRVSLLRCGAARTLAGADFHDKLLAACDVSGAIDADGGAQVPGGIGARSLVEVIGRNAIVGPRLAAFRAGARAGDLRAREAAIELLEKHDEVEGAAALLTEALTAPESGLVATAAEVLSKQPQRAVDDRAPVRKGKRHGKKKVDLQLPTVDISAPSPALVKALLDALARPAVDADPEFACSVADAAGALALKEARPRLEELCRSPYPTTREHAAKAIALAGGEKKACDPPPEGSPPPPEIDHLSTATVSRSTPTPARSPSPSIPRSRR